MSEKKDENLRSWFSATDKKSKFKNSPLVIDLFLNCLKSLAEKKFSNKYFFCKKNMKKNYDHDRYMRQIDETEANSAYQIIDDGEFEEKILILGRSYGIWNIDHYGSSFSSFDEWMEFYQRAASVSDRTMKKKDLKKMDYVQKMLSSATLLKYIKIFTKIETWPRKMHSSISKEKN